MTRADFKNMRPGTRLKIGLDFVEDPHDSLVEYLGTVQVFERAELTCTGWAYFKDLPQPFAFSEIEGFAYDCQCIDDDAVPYELGDTCLIFGEVPV